MGSMRKNLWIVLILAIFLRIFLSAISYHSDVQAFNFTGTVVSQGYFFSFYDYLPNLASDSLILKTYPVHLFNYPPLVYYFFTGISILANSISGSFIVNSFLFNYSTILGNLGLNLHLLVLKLPYLIFDLPIAFFLMKFFVSERDKFLAFLLWMFNPVNLYATYLVGQFDIIPVFFVMASLYLLLGRNQPVSGVKILTSVLLLGLGAAFKIFPLLLLIPLLSLITSWRGRAVLFLVGFLPYIVTMLPFMPSKGFRTTALFANQSFKSFYPQIPVSGGESILLFLAFLIFFYLLFFQKTTTVKLLWQYFLIVLLLFFIFTHYHPQWFLWITPFFVLALIYSGFRNVLPVLLSLLSFTGLLFFFDSGLTISLFSPLFPQTFQLPSVWELLRVNIDYNFFRSVLQTIFIGSAVFLIYYHFPKDSHS